MNDGKIMEKFEVIKKAFETERDEKNAVAMSKYMRDLFEFYGLATPRRKAVYKSHKKNDRLFLSLSKEELTGKAV